MPRNPRPPNLWPPFLRPRGPGLGSLRHSPNSGPSYRTCFPSVTNEWRLSPITFHDIPWHSITFHHITLHCIALHSVLLQYIALHCITLYYNLLHSTKFLCMTILYINLNLHYIEFHSIALHYIAYTLHYIQRITLH